MWLFGVIGGGVIILVISGLAAAFIVVFRRIRKKSDEKKKILSESSSSTIEQTNDELAYRKPPPRPINSAPTQSLASTLLDESVSATNFDNGTLYASVGDENSASPNAQQPNLRDTPETASGFNSTPNQR